MKAQVLTTETSEIELLSLASPVFITGAAYAGKSELALAALRRDRRCDLLVTCDPNESEFKTRIEELSRLHAEGWTAHYQTEGMVEAIARSDAPQILIDSLSQWIATRLVECHGRYSLEEIHGIVASECKRFITEIRDAAADKRVVVVSTEVGGGPTPPAALARLFRLLSSKTAVAIAGLARSVVVMHAGIPLVIKGGR